MKRRERKEATTIDEEGWEGLTRGCRIPVKKSPPPSTHSSHPTKKMSRAGGFSAEKPADPDVKGLFETPEVRVR